jgi:hypothetical protein
MILFTANYGTNIAYKYIVTSLVGKIRHRMCAKAGGRKGLPDY